MKIVLFQTIQFSTNVRDAYACGNKINNKDERTQFFRKIDLLHFILERVAKVWRKGHVWEVS